LFKNQKPFTVEASGIATIENIIINDFQDNNTATIQVTSSSLGDYEYSLNGVNYQDSNILNNLTAGEYTVYIQDKKRMWRYFRNFLHPRLSKIFHAK